jgi:hypothetical protein
VIKKIRPPETINIIAQTEGEDENKTNPETEKKEAKNEPA